ncbi:MAG: hypothetical protein KHW90_06205 [Clostridiales bacterium]|nr:hypothetical protein [Clostridiales bacterium]
MLIRMLTAAAYAQEYQTVSQLRESVPARWTTTIETKWRDVDIDAEIVTPDVEAIPVVKVGYDLHPSPLTPEESGWVEVNDSYETGSLILYMTDDTGKPPRKINGRKVNRDPVSKENWYGGFDPNQTYIPLSDIRFSEIQDLIRDELVKFGYPPEDFDLETPERMWLQHWYFAGTKEDAAPAEILMNLYTKLNGITVYGHILDAVRNTRGERARKDGFWDSMTTTVAYEGVIDRLSLLFISHLLPVETLAEDVPLCSFDTIQKSLEQEIKKGRVRKIYEISLGYVLYCEPGAYHEWGQKADYSSIFYDVKPMWRVNCLKASGAQKELEESDEDDERNSVAYTQMLVDAQTGEIIGQSDAADRSMFPGFLTWEDVNK